MEVAWNDTDLKLMAPHIWNDTDLKLMAPYMCLPPEESVALAYFSLTKIERRKKEERRKMVWYVSEVRTESTYHRNIFPLEHSIHAN